MSARDRKKSRVTVLKKKRKSSAFSNSSIPGVTNSVQCYQSYKFRQPDKKTGRAFGSQPPKGKRVGINAPDAAFL